MRVDLHTHSTASDGLLAPARLVMAARRHGVGVLALTDHDSTEGLAEAEAAGETYGVEVIPGVEINTDVDAHEVHILGYHLDYAHGALQTFLSQRREDRMTRAVRMVERLRALGVPIEWARVGEIAGGGAVGRPHIARALAESGVVVSPQEAFERFLGRNGPVYVPRTRVTPEEAVEAILQAGGVPVLAHPGWAAGGPVFERLPSLVGSGLAGIEVYYPDHTPAMIAAYLEVARRYGLVATGGTDYHGGGLATRAPLGSAGVPPEVVPALRARWEALRAAPVREFRA